jgi:TRAP-type mannitol/chloroaromatic compound transport system permease small subunit
VRAYTCKQEIELKFGLRQERSQKANLVYDSNEAKDKETVSLIVCLFDLIPVLLREIIFEKIV